MANVAAAAILATIPTMFLLKQLTIHLAKIELLFFVSMKAFSRACPHFDLHQIKMHAKRNMAL